MTDTTKKPARWRLERHKRRMEKQAEKRKAWLERKKRKLLLGGVA